MALVVNKTYQDGQILGEASLDDAFNSIVDYVNEGQLTGDNIQNNSIGPAEIQTSAITTPKIADGAVTTPKIADGAITLAKLAANIVELIGIPGDITAYGGDTAPAGWLLCDGAAVSRVTYSNLFAVVGSRFGQGDGSSTFNVPDLRGRFLRGVDSGSGRDPDAATRTAMNTGGATGDNVGSVQSDAFQDHRHDQITITNSIPAAISTLTTPTNVARNSSAGLTGFASARNTPDSTRTSTETRPKNVNVNFIIKV